MLAGPGMVSLDALFGTKVPWWFSFLALAGSGVGVVMATRPDVLEPAAPAPQRLVERAPSNGEPAHARAGSAS